MAARAGAGSGTASVWSTGMLAPRIAKTLMVLGLAAFAILVTVNNITDYGSNFAFVTHVLSMDDTFPDNALLWRAITDPTLWHVGYWLIIAGEGVTGVLFLAAAVAMFRTLSAPASGFARAKRLVHYGAATGFLVWFVGFMVVGGEWFAMWQSSVWNGQEAAFRFYMTILGVLIYVSLPDPD
ncbi:membrane protein [Tistrella bauzanensis]|uniref:Membrane protein n=1 Tax=Tistrella bauzanensis TaxID=657419 RepID=A0ABQ1ICT0_9PROT|nr:membrane protein [Tistrella bauzanensis]